MQILHHTSPNIWQHLFNYTDSRTTDSETNDITWLLTLYMYPENVTVLSNESQYTGIIQQILKKNRVPAGGNLWSQLAIFFLQFGYKFFPFGYTIFLIIHQIKELGSIFLNLVANLATTLKIPEGTLPIPRLYTNITSIHQVFQ